MEEVEIIRSRRRTVAVEIKEDLRVLVRVPLGMPERDIQRLVLEKRPWIETHLQRAKARRARQGPPLTAQELRSLSAAAAEDLLRRVEEYAPRVGVTVGRVTIRRQRSRWGSCSAKGNLNFNCLLMLCPEEVRDYVVVHELCHRRELNHSAAFWALVEAALPGYRSPQGWLRENGGAIIGRLEK